MLNDSSGYNSSQHSAKHGNITLGSKDSSVHATNLPQNSNYETKARFGHQLKTDAQKGLKINLKPHKMSNN